LLANSDPSENESGVTLMIPMQTGEDKSIFRSPALRENFTVIFRFV